MDGSRIILAAHRGDKFRYPENTMPAFESAVSLGVDMIETDVRMSKDGELIKDTGMMVNWEFKVYPSDFDANTAFEVVDKLVNLIDEYDMADRSMMNSFSAKVLEYIYNEYKNKFPIHGQGIYKCKRSCELS